MNKNSNSRTAPPRNGSSIVAALLVGMVLGLALAGLVAWFMLERPNQFLNKMPHETSNLTPDPVKPLPAPVTMASPDTPLAPAEKVEDKPRFEFYKVLTDKNDKSTRPKVPPKQARKPDLVEQKKATYFVQAGAFSNAADADKLKAKLTMLGMEPRVKATTLADQSVWHRVRLGPYSSTDEMNKAMYRLKQNGVPATRAP
ncbi:MAG: SPOR domain-containing protein [Gallionellaceae bacterium]